MYFKIRDNRFFYRDTPNSIDKSLDLSMFDFVSGFRYSEDTHQIFLTGVVSGEKTPTLSENNKGDLRLYKSNDIGEGWEEITSSYAHDPVPIANNNYVAFHNGSGVSVVDDSGVLIFESKVGRFNWGAPSVSSSPDGTRISYVKWEGDNQKLISGTLKTNKMERYKPRLFRYSWFDEDTIVYQGVGHVKLLDLNTGKSKRFFQDFVKELKDCIELDNDNQEFEEFITNNEVYLLSIGEMQTTKNDLLLACQLFSYTPEHDEKDYHGLFSISKDKENIKLIKSFDKGTAIKNIEIDRRGNIQLFLEHRKGIKEISKSIYVVGPDSDYLKDDWMIMRVGTHPEFGFHYIGQLEQ